MKKKVRFVYDAAMVADMTRRYESGESLWSIAIVYGVTHPTIKKVLSLHGVPLRTRKEALALNSGERHPKHGKPMLPHVREALMASLTRRGRGSDHASWKGGRYVNEQGYVMVYMPEHPHASSNGYVREHRLVMEGMLGRTLRPDEAVHHINHKRDDNRPENLQYCATHSEHQAIHARDRMGAFPQKNCAGCGKPLRRAKFSNGASESPAAYARRKHCSRACVRARRSACA